MLSWRTFLFADDSMYMEECMGWGEPVAVALSVRIASPYSARVRLTTAASLAVVGSFPEFA